MLEDQTVFPADLVVMDLDGRQLAGDRKASSEIAMHLMFYRMRPDVGAICHAHPPTATGFAVAGRALDHALLPEVIVGLGQIPLVKYGTPGTPELSAAIEPYVMHYDALLPDCFPDTAAIVESMGWRVRVADISELRKAEAGVTCSSLIFK